MNVMKYDLKAENAFSRVKGWKDIVIEAIQKIAALSENVEISQIYQKYDELRFDIDPTGDKELDKQIDIIIDEAEEKSLKVCVYCGASKAEGTQCSNHNQETKTKNDIDELKTGKFRKQRVLLFAYGSMKKGFRNHYRIENDGCMGAATTIDKYNMYPSDNFNYPYAIENEKKWQLHGELYELWTTDISWIDDFEGAPDYYYRKEIEVTCKGHNYKAFMYFRASTNLTGMDADIALNEWTKEFENVGVKNNEFLDALGIALKKKIEDLTVSKMEIVQNKEK